MFWDSLLVPYSGFKSPEDGTYSLSVKQEVRNYRLTLHAVYCVAFTHIKNCYLSCIWQLWTALFSIHGDMSSSLPLTWKHKGFKNKQYNYREFHSKVVINKDMIIFVNICSTLNFTLRNLDCEGFSITQLLLISSYLVLFIIFYLVFISFVLHFYVNYT